MPTLKQILLACTFAGFANLANAGESAVYQIRFESFWSSTSHPGAYPASAHFSSLIGATHSAEAVFWQPGTLASPGIQQMAELGGVSLLTGEVNAQIALGRAYSVINGSAIGSPGSTIISAVNVQEAFPQISLVTMLAPSPDWFVGVHGAALVVDGAWVPTLSVDLFTYDSGTDDGLNFISPNAASVPHVPVELIASANLANGVALGRFTFTLVSATGAPDHFVQTGFE